MVIYRRIYRSTEHESHPDMYALVLMHKETSSEFRARNLLRAQWVVPWEGGREGSSYQTGRVTSYLYGMYEFR